MLIWCSVIIGNQSIMFFNIINVTFFLLNMFVKTQRNIFREFKEQHLWYQFKLILFDQFKASLLNKSINFFLVKIILNSKFWMVYHGFHKNIKQQKVISTLKIIRNYSLATIPSIKMIFEGSCVTENWSNGCWNIDLHQRNKLHF